MSEFFLDRKSLAFFMGGDNFMVVANDDAKEMAMEFIDKTKKDLGILLNCGIGIGKTSREAAKLATQSLENPVEELLAAASGKPMLAKLLDGDERLATRKKLATDILKLLRGNLSLVNVAKTWEKTPKTDLLDWQLQWVQAMIKSKYLADSVPADTISPHLYKLMIQSIASLWELYDGLMELKSHAHTSLSPLLFTENMLLLWKNQSLSR